MGISIGVIELFELKYSSRLLNVKTFLHASFLLNYVTIVVNYKCK